MLLHQRFLSNSNGLCRYSLAVSHRSDAASEAVCSNSMFKCMAQRIKHMQVRVVKKEIPAKKYQRDFAL